MSPTRLRVAAALALALVGLFAIQSYRWSGEAGAERAHRKFLSAVADRRWGKCHRMISEAYSDRWGFGRREISLALKDVGGQFTFALQIDWETRSVTALEGGGYEITGNAELDGRGSPAVDLILREARAYSRRPYTFRWAREGLLPWRWKLQRADHPDAEVPPGYVPGDLGSLADLF